MKTNFKKLSGAVLTVAMVGAMSLTAFAADVKTEKITKAIAITTEATSSTPTTPLTGENTIKADLKVADDFTITTQKDGSFLLTNKKTGETVQVVMAQKVIPTQKIVTK